MKRLSEFKHSEEEYTLTGIKGFRDQIEFEDLSWGELQGMIKDLYEANGLLIDYAARLERGGYGD
ncbi:hypothetical protein FE331_00535 [Dolosigranulum pigrum]|uniref:hypothetical protein n=1 Tax=Dolosigranulum pigrum TaxID=29394 RepID=UPI001AD8983C|nr:hypothetical protein [Dolosigranulum pigrum]QTJ49207.1 hypothetical protein FE331_00535 [Dolosigranulum pigrum]